MAHIKLQWMVILVFFLKEVMPIIYFLGDTMSSYPAINASAWVVDSATYQIGIPHRDKVIPKKGRLVAWQLTVKLGKYKQLLQVWQKVSLIGGRFRIKLIGQNAVIPPGPGEHVISVPVSEQIMVDEGHDFVLGTQWEGKGDIYYSKANCSEGKVPKFPYLSHVFEPEYDYPDYGVNKSDEIDLPNGYDCRIYALGAFINTADIVTQHYEKAQILPGDFSRNTHILKMTNERCSRILCSSFCLQNGGCVGHHVLRDAPCACVLVLQTTGTSSGFPTGEFYESVGGEA